MGKKFASEGTIKKIMDLSMKLFPSNEVTDTEVSTMWDSLNSTPTELDLNYKYTLDKPNTVVTLQQYIGTDPVVIVKSSYDKDDVTYNTKIASNDSSSNDYMFSGNDTVETVDFEEGVTVGSNIDKMFKNCINLKSVNLGNVDLSNITSVDNTFSGTTNLEKVTEDVNTGIPDTVDKSNMFTNSSIIDTTETLDGIEIGPESELSNWNYTLDDNNTVTLNEFTNTTTNIDVIVYGAYKKGDKIYKSKLKPNTYNIFTKKTNIKTITFNPGVDSSECYYMPDMFCGCTALTTINGLENLDTSNVTNMSFMFANTSVLTTINGLENLDTSNVTDMNNMFSSSRSLTSLDLRSFDTSKVTKMTSMFNGCTNITSLDLTGWDTSNVTNMNGFLACGTIPRSSVLTEIKGIENWDVSNVTDMNSFFFGLINITSLDLTGWDTSKVKHMGSMFRDCSKLTEIKVSKDKWKISSGCDTTNMFKDCAVSAVTYVD